jgi:hypothetical protein
MRKILIRPSKEELIILVKTKRISHIAKQYGVESSSTIIAWCEFYGLNYKEISPFCHENKVNLC